MLVDSSGSMNPLESPTATQFLIQLLAPDPALKRSTLRLGQRFALDIAEQPSSALLVEIAAAEDDSVAGAMLQRNAPLPAGIVRHRPRVGDRRATERSGSRSRCRRAAMRPVLEADLSAPLDQQRRESRCSR